MEFFIVTMVGITGSHILAYAKGLKKTSVYKHGECQYSGLTATPQTHV